ncbi:FGGY-family carbohydrate kinase [Octadecabacter sp.]|nr:FGGY-family carbohydrate kinase [Octadecabacter sp.]
MTIDHVAVIDIGKTNAKLALVKLADLSEIAVVTQPNVVLDGPPYPHFDVEGHWTFLLDHLRDFHANHGIDAISITTHGAAAALLGADGTLAAPILDYEHTGPDALAATYDVLRPPFAETGSPRLAMGLNLGAQIHYQFETVPDLRAMTETIVTYPQYWGFRLTGVAATDVTSLGTHTDLWNPYERRFSSLVARLGITDKIAAPTPCDDVIGPILSEVADYTGLSARTPVYCGIHDSNASLLPHILKRTAPFSVLSTGTWVIAMAVGGKPVTLDPTRDTLVNVNAFGNPVPSARFMGGREHDLATGGPYPKPTDENIQAILDAGTMLLPAVVPEIGPFRGMTARWIGTEPAIGTVERGVCTAFYLALVTAQCLKMIGHRGPIIVEGPFRENTPFLRMLARVTDCVVALSDSTTGTSSGAAMLADANGRTPQSGQDHFAPQNEFSEQMVGYAQKWKDCADR